MNSFDEAQSLALDFFEFIIEGLKALDKVVSLLILQPCIPSDAMLLNDLQYTNELLLKAVSQLQPVRQKLLNFHSSDTETMKVFVLDISEYVRNDVFDMTLLTIEATAARFQDEFEVETQLENASLINSTINQMNQYYASDDASRLRESFNDLSAVLKIVNGETS